MLRRSPQKLSDTSRGDCFSSNLRTLRPPAVTDFHTKLRSRHHAALLTSAGGYVLGLLKTAATKVGCTANRRPRRPTGDRDVFLSTLFCIVQPWREEQAAKRKHKLGWLDDTFVGRVQASACPFPPTWSCVWVESEGAEAVFNRCYLWCRYSKSRIPVWGG